MFLSIKTVGLYGHQSLQGWTLIEMNELPLMNEFIGNLIKVNITQESLSEKEKFVSLFDEKFSTCAKLVYNSFDQLTISKLYSVKICLSEIFLQIGVIYNNGREETTEFKIEDKDIAYNGIYIEILKTIKEIGFYDWKQLVEKYKNNPVAVLNLMQFFPKGEDYKVTKIVSRSDLHEFNYYKNY